MMKPRTALFSCLLALSLAAPTAALPADSATSAAHAPDPTTSSAPASPPTRPQPLDSFLCRIAPWIVFACSR
ncbi:hypothetical protein [Actinomyces respiraculi]|uniref:hypothetical protein n=1 Tax=Actinomyces respiraculi TaxID=2744574 RepID=UPI001421AEE4|nr:hypothetical protein [Actinomyces respiraculi]